MHNELTTIIFTCQKEHLTYEDLEQDLKTQKSTTKTVSANDIPEVMNFIATKSADNKFVLDDGNNKKGMNFGPEDNLVMTELITDEITQATNAYAKSNYTFKLIKQSSKQDGNYFLNLVVKEYKDTFYLYIVKYVPDENWLSTHSITKDFGDFTGRFYYYNDQGIYVANVTMQNGGTTTYSYNNPCSDNTDDGIDYPDDGGTGGGNGDGDGGGGGDTCFIIATWYQCEGSDASTPHSPSSCNAATGTQTGSGYNYTYYCTENNYSANNLNAVLRTPCEGSGGASGGGNNNYCQPDPDCVFPMQLNENCECTMPDAIENDEVAVNPEKDGDCDTSKEDLKKIFPSASDSDMETLASVINQYGKDLGVNTKEELQHFLSQAGHETGGFNQGIGAEESLYYTTSSRLKSVYKNYFWQTVTDTLNKRNPDDYLYNSSKVANYVYADRMGNGNEASEDGYKYRGRGVFQLTGKTNYTAFKDWYNGKYDPDKDFVTNPEILKNNDTIAIISALWFYKKNVLDKISLDSTTTVKTVTKKVNGGLNGLTDRKEIFQKAKDSITCIQN